MRLVTFQRNGEVPQAGILEGDKVSGTGMDMLTLIASGETPKPAGPSYEVGKVKLLAPIPRPPKLICVGLNYHDQAAEAKLEVPSVPTIFCKFPNTVIASGEKIVLPNKDGRTDYEAEFAFVIGPGGRRIPAPRAMNHVFGYTIINDVSERRYQNATSQWMIGKTFDTFAPMGPCLVTADEVPDPHALDISLEIAGERLQNSNTRELIFKIPELIEFLSSVVTLEPGDVVSTGTPAGVGFARNPPRFLKPGDEVVIRIAHIGELRNPVSGEA